MPNVLRNVLAVVGGVAVGMIVNMTIIAISPVLVPPPAGVDVSNAESLSRGMHLFQTRHFAMPFLAHALGTLAGALAAFLIAASYRTQMAFVTGAVFLSAGIAASFMVPAPAWFITVDLLFAYLPMAWLATRIGSPMKAPVGNLR